MPMPSVTVAATTNIAPLGGGRVLYDDPVVGRPVLVHLCEAEDGRLEIDGIEVPPTGGPITGEWLRRVPLGRIEAQVNQAPLRDLVLATLAEGSAAVGVRWLTNEQLLGMMATATVIPSKASAAVARRLRLRLQVPDGHRYPDSFYEKVAALYKDLAAQGGRPAAEIAKANRVPVTTVHRWIREARRRKLLPPGRAGKAG
jgi:hypothetical protein